MNRKEYRRQLLDNEPDELKLQRLHRRYSKLLMKLYSILPASKKMLPLILAELQKEWLRINKQQARREGAILATEVYCDFITKEGGEND